MKGAIAVLPLAVLLVGCSAGVGVSPAPTPATSATISPPPAGSATATVAATPAVGANGSPSYGVLVDLLTSAGSYIASVVRLDGTVVTNVEPAKRSPIQDPRGDAVVLPYVSTSLSALYYLVGDSTVHSIRLDGTRTLVTRLDVGAGMEATFAVSPDDRTMAVGVLDFNRTPVHVHIYTQDVAGGNRHDIYDSDTNYVWPIAWHAGLLVLAHAYGPFEQDIAKSAPGQDNPYSAISYHIVDPANANRIYLLGACTVSGPLSPAGSACIQGGTIDWFGNVSPPWSTRDWGSISSAAALSPDGKMVAAADPDYPTHLDIWRPDGTISTWGDGPDPRDWAGWLDATHILIDSALNPYWQPSIITLSAGPSPAAVIDAHGFYAAQLPTDIV